MPDFTQKYANMKYFDVEQMTYLAPYGSIKRTRQTLSADKTLTPFECYTALIKGYCVILVLILPRSFVIGGYAATAGLVLGSGFLSAVCASLLVQAGLKENLYSYSLLTQKVLGDKWKVIIDMIIALAQFSFTVSHISFII